ncbi:MAG: PIN domain-containing protein [Candidatus Taylorbacteria bacterium]|nr:PIN domain-containing protein [Candidatus Taylorbacteria bacterium]
MQKSKLDKKHILLDTCFIAKVYTYSDTEYFDKLFSIFNENNCTTIVNEFIKFEFLRGCKKAEHIKNKEKFLEGLSYVSLPVTPEILNDAIKISNIYSNKNISPKQISIVDCYISAYLKKYRDNLLLITLDNNDFPLLLHDRIIIETIDTEKEILVLGIYSFNLCKYNKALESLDEQ